jgi:hypothetical protein
MAKQSHSTEGKKRVLQSIEQLKRLVKKSEKIVWNDKVKNTRSLRKILQMNRKARLISMRAQAIINKTK